MQAKRPIYYGHDAANSYLKTVAQFDALNSTAGDVIVNNTVYSIARSINRNVNTPAGFALTSNGFILTSNGLTLTTQ
jgi:hypothetical protein